MFFIILSLAGGGYAYLQKLQKDNAILKINTTKLESAVSQNEQVIKQQTQDFEKVRTTLGAVQYKNKKMHYKATKMNSLRSYKDTTSGNLHITNQV